jgi:hypothetical protein
MNECYNIVVVVKVATAVRGGVWIREQRSRARSRRGGGLGKPNRGRGRGETFFPDSGSDRDNDETFQISRNLGLEHIEFFCLLDSQPCAHVCIISPWSEISMRIAVIFVGELALMSSCVPQ